MTEERDETIALSETLPTKFQIGEDVILHRAPGVITGVAFRTIGQTLPKDTPVKVFYIVRMFDGTVREVHSRLLSYP